MSASRRRWVVFGALAVALAVALAALARVASWWPVEREPEVGERFWEVVRGWSKGGKG